MGKEALIADLKIFKKNVEKEMPINNLILFGSSKKGNISKGSDIDLIIISEKFQGIKHGRGKGLHKIWHINSPADFLCYTPKEFEEMKNQISIVSHALKYGKIIN